MAAAIKDAFNRQDYQKAYELLNQAIETHPGNYKSHDSRSATAVKLGMPKQALMDAKKQIQLRPDGEQGYKRAADAYRAIGKLGNAAQILLAGIDACTKADKPKASLLAAQVSIEAERKASVTSTEILPAELFVYIVQYLPHYMQVRCSHVSRAWRHILLAEPSIWQTLSLTGKDRAVENKANAYVQRLADRRALDTFAFQVHIPAQWERLRSAVPLKAFSTLRSLQCSFGPTVSPALSANVLLWSMQHRNIRSLSFDATEGAMPGLCLSLEAICDFLPNLRHLHAIGIAKPGTAFPVSGPYKMSNDAEAVQRLESLVISPALVELPDYDIDEQPFSSLQQFTYRQLEGGFTAVTIGRSTSLRFLCSPLAHLRSLTLVKAQLSQFTAQLVGPALASFLVLRKLVLKNCEYWVVKLFLEVDAPALESLAIEHAKGCPPPYADMPTQIFQSPRLQELSLVGLPIADDRSVIDILSPSSALIMLDLSASPITDRFLSLLPTLAPNLKILALSANDSIKASPLMKFVTAGWDQEKQAGRLTRLELVNCASIEPAGLEWLKKNVKLVNHSYSDLSEVKRGRKRILA